MKMYYALFSILLVVSSPLLAEGSSCLGGVCLGDNPEKLAEDKWIARTQMSIHDQSDLPTLGAVQRFKMARSAMGIHANADTTTNPITRIAVDRIESFLEKYVIGLSEDQMITLSPYFIAMFFDQEALSLLNNAVACKGKKLQGFKQTKQGNLDLVLIFPSGETGKFEVVGIERQFKKMDAPQKEQLFSALKEKYPNILTRNEALHAISRGNWDLNQPMIYWDEYRQILRLTKIIEIPVVGYGKTTGLAMAIDSNEASIDDKLLSNPTCLEKLAPPMDID